MSLDPGRVTDKGVRSPRLWWEMEMGGAKKPTVAKEKFGLPNPGVRVVKKEGERYHQNDHRKPGKSESRRKIVAGQVERILCQVKVFLNLYLREGPCSKN